MNIRPFDDTMEEARGIIKVEQATFGEFNMAEEALIALANKPGNKFFVAVEDGVVGFVSTMEAHTLHGHGVWIDLVAVDPNSQNRGIGEQLVQAALNYAQAVGADYTSALVKINNAPSLKVLKRAGYDIEPVPFQLMLKDL